MIRYYSTERPVMPGSFPKPDGNRIEQIVNFPARAYIEDVHKQAWGFIDYEKPLTNYDAQSYELVPVITGCLHLLYIGMDSWSRYVYEDEHGKLWKLIDVTSPRECLERRGDVPVSSCGNSLDGEPDCPMPLHIRPIYVKHPCSGCINEDKDRDIDRCWNCRRNASHKPDNYHARKEA